MAERRNSDSEPRVVCLDLNGVYFRMQMLVDEEAEEEEEQKPEEEEEDIPQQQVQTTTCSSSEDVEQKQIETYTYSDDEDIGFQTALFYSTIFSSRSGQEGDFKKTPDEKKKGVETRSCTSIRYGDFRSPAWRTKEIGTSSQTLCDICMDVKPTGGMIRSKDCPHAYCRDCFGSYIGEKIQENIGNVKCPGPKCQILFQLDHCRPYIPEQVFDRWRSAAVEAYALGSPGYLLCPFDDCCAVFADDGKGFLIRACPVCWRLFCPECNVPWHAWMSCRLYQTLRRRAFMFLKP